MPPRGVPFDAPRGVRPAVALAIRMLPAMAPADEPCATFGKRPGDTFGATRFGKKPRDVLFVLGLADSGPKLIATEDEAMGLGSCSQVAESGAERFEANALEAVLQPCHDGRLAGLEGARMFSKRATNFPTLPLRGRSRGVVARWGVGVILDVEAGRWRMLAATGGEGGAKSAASRTSCERLCLGEAGGCCLGVAVGVPLSASLPGAGGAEGAPPSCERLCLGEAGGCGPLGVAAGVPPSASLSSLWNSAPRVL